MIKVARHLLCLGLLMTMGSAEAGLLRLESETISSMYNRYDLHTRFPNYEYLGTNYLTDAGDFEFNSSLGVFGDPNDGSGEFDLYLFNLRYRPLSDNLTLYAGRNFDVEHAINASFVDEVGVEGWLFSRHLKVGAFVGQEHKVEQADPYANVVGVYSKLLSSGVYPGRLSATAVHKEYSRVAPAADIAKLSAHQVFGGPWGVEAYLDNQNNLSTGHLNRLEVGTDLYPNLLTLVRLRAQSFELTENDGIEQPIYSIFAQGRLYEVSGQVQYRFWPQLIGSLLIGYDDYLVSETGDLRSHGVRGEGELQWRGEHLRLANALYYLYSLGGKAYGDRITVDRALSERVQLNGGLDVTYYEKITSAKSWAFNSMAGTTLRLADHFRLSGLAEFNSNNILNYEWRAMAKLVYVLWAEP